MKKRSHFNIFLISILTVLGNTPASAALILDPAQPITHRITVQPIIVSDDNGLNTATFFGNTGQQSIIEGLVDNIWAQASIDINFLTPNSWSNTFANSGDPTDNNPRPVSDLNDIANNGTSAGVTHSDPNVVNIFFINIAAGFSIFGDNTAAGLAFRPGNDISQYVGANLPGFSNGRDVIASVVAHEIGHNLGLPHLVDFQNLMQLSASPNQGGRLNSIQITTALNSNLSIAIVPLPAAIWFLGSGLIGLISLSKTRKA